MLAAAIAFAWYLHGMLQRMYGMTGDAWDLTFYQQLVWAISQGDWWAPGFLTRNVELLLLPIAAIEKLWPSPSLLAMLSAAGLAAAGPAAYLFFRALLPAERSGAAWLAVALTAPVPFWAATQQAASNFFHPDEAALAFALVAGWAGLRGRRAWMWSFILLDLACSEDQFYSTLVLALLLRVYGAPAVKKQWRFVLYVAGAWFLLELVDVNPSLPASWMAAGAALLSPASLLMVGAIIASMFALPLLGPRWLLLAIPPYVAGALGDHGVLPLMFPLMVAGGVGARRFLERTRLQPAVAIAFAAPALVLGWGGGAFPPALLAPSPAFGHSSAVAELQEATSVIPPGAPVDADAGLDVWLANRPEITDFPGKLDASSYIVIDRQHDQAVGSKPAARDAAVAALPNSGRELVYDDGRFQVWSPVGD
jgi:hypothetical protein